MFLFIFGATFLSSALYAEEERFSTRGFLFPEKDLKILSIIYGKDYTFIENETSKDKIIKNLSAASKEAEDFFKLPQALNKLINIDKKKEKIEITDPVLITYARPKNYCEPIGLHWRLTNIPKYKNITNSIGFNDFIFIIHDTDEKTASSTTVPPAYKDWDKEIMPGVSETIAHEMGHTIFSYERPEIDNYPGFLTDDRKNDFNKLRYRLRFVSTESYAVYVQYLYQLHQDKKTDNKSNFVHYITQVCDPEMALSLLLFSEVKGNEVTYTYSKLDKVEELLKNEDKYKSWLILHPEKDFKQDIIMSFSNWEVVEKEIRDGTSSPRTPEPVKDNDGNFVEITCSVGNEKQTKREDGEKAVNTLLELVASNTQMRYGKTGEEEN